MIVAEVAMQRLHDEVCALESGCSTEQEVLFASGALAAIAWFANPELPSPFIAMFQQLGPRQTH